MRSLLTKVIIATTDAPRLLPRVMAVLAATFAMTKSLPWCALVRAAHGLCFQAQY